MASVWKRGGRSNRTGTYRCAIVDHSGQQRVRRTFSTGTSDRGAADEIARKVSKLLAYRTAQCMVDAELATWLAKMPYLLRAELTRAGILHGPQAAEGRPLAFHLIGYAHALKSKGDDAKHIRITIRRIAQVFFDCDIHYWPHLTTAKVNNYITRRRLDEAKGRKRLGPGTSNQYMTALIAFCNWAVGANRLGVNPLTSLKKLPVTEDEHRWPLTSEEMQKLLDATVRGPVRFKMPGVERALLYRVAVETGYRAGELASLTKANFDLTSAQPTVRVLGRCTKGKRRSTIPLRPDTCKLLKEHLATKSPNDKAFMMPTSDHTAELIRADLIDAEIPLVDSLGRKRDFHALRHTQGTWLSEAGVHPKVIQMMMRHSTIRLTMDRYAHSGAAQASAALERMPSFTTSRGEVGAVTQTERVEQGGAQSGAHNQQSNPTAPASIGTEVVLVEDSGET